MAPTSAAIADPTRPATNRAVMTGPSSLTMESPTIPPMFPSRPNWARRDPVWSASTPPMKIAISEAMGSVALPNSHKWVRILSAFLGAALAQ